jgi:hypothetical protein
VKFGGLRHCSSFPHARKFKRLSPETPPHFHTPPSAPQHIRNIHPPKMSKKATIPDAWDDDWESQADKVDAETEKANAEQKVKISKAERLARHAETNKKIWESA